MAEKLLRDLMGNEVLGKPILSSNYQVILPAGAVIRPEYVDKLMELGIQSVYIKEVIINNTPTVNDMYNIFLFSFL